MDYCAHNEVPYNVIGNLVNPYKLEIVYKPMLEKRTRKRFSLFFVKEYQKVGAIKETHRGK